MASDHLERLDRERRDADARYNDALTALDRAIVSTVDREIARDDIARIGTALLAYLQKITAFVETKDRQIAAEAETRASAIERSLNDIGELRTQLAVLRRSVESLTDRLRPTAAQSPATDSVIHDASSRAAAAERRSDDGDARARSSRAYDGPTYIAFEDAFRGSDRAIEERLRAYVPLFEGRSDVLDIGCGRGEMLAALQAAGIAARGIDVSGAMVSAARGRGVAATEADALAYVSALPPGSLGGVVATQVVEHLEPAYLIELVAAIARALRPGSPVVVETINPACWLAFFSSYVRDLTHVRPVHPDTMQYLLRAAGFERVSIEYSAAVPDHMKMKTIDLPAELLAAHDASAAGITRIAGIVNANAVILNNLMFTHLDYAAVGYRM
jgi:O-antigen chain-terminating methyltransferase